MMLRPTALLLALTASTLAWGQALDTPARIAHLSYVEGEIQFQAAGAPATHTLPDRPLASGDRLITGHDARAEFAFGTATIRLDGQSELTLLALDPSTVRLELASGTASVYLRELLEDETFEILTPNAAIALDEPGEYRVDVRAEDASELTVRGGAAEVATAGGPVRIAGGQRVRLEGRNALARLETLPPADPFDDWVLERELRLAEAEPPRYTPYEGDTYDTYDELDRHGEWYDEPRYGRVWMPSYGYAGWSPYHSGYWQQVGFGWSWINPSPWGYYTFHSGRWAFLHDRNRWCWVPGPRHHRPHDDNWQDRMRHRQQDDVRRTVVRSTGENWHITPARRPAERATADSGERQRRGIYQRSVIATEKPQPQPAAETPRGGRETPRAERAPRERPQRDSDARLRPSRESAPRQEP